MNQPHRRRARDVVATSARILLAAFMGIAGVAVMALHATTASATVAFKSALDEQRATSLRPRAVAPGTWDNATEVPGTAALNVGQNAGVYSISCSSAGNCSAGGQYSDVENHSQAFVVNETNGTWGSAIEVPGTASLNAGGNAVVWSLSCSSAGNCGAAGSYTDSANDVRGFVVNETGGTWGTASEVMDPSAIGSMKALGAESISCSGTGSCTATGDDVVAGGSSVGFAVSETGAVWSDATEITITSTFGSGGTSLDNVACSSPGNCSAAGNGLYPDTAVSGGDANIPFESDETNGTWSTPILFPSLATLNVGEESESTTISCSAPGDCSAGGSYEGTTTNTEAWVALETAGTWGDAIEVPGVAALNHSDAALNGVSCTSANACVLVGFYTDLSGNPIAFADGESPTGTWNNAYSVTFTSGPYEDGTGSIGDSISCAAYVCAIAGVSFEASGNAQAFVDVLYPVGQQYAMVVPGTGVLNTAGDGFASSISCSADSSCAAGGWYSNSTNEYQAFTSGMTPALLTQAPLQITTLHGQVGTGIQLSTSGGSGSGPVTYSVANGSARGCAVGEGFLTSTTAGTCLVTATKGFDLVYLPLSSTSAVEMDYPPKPPPLTVHFASSGAALSAGAKKELDTLSRRLITGALVTVTGYAKGNAPLARRRAATVRNSLEVFGLHVTIKANTSAGHNTATIVTNRE